MSIQTDIDNFKNTINGCLTRDHINTLLDFLTGLEKDAKDTYISNFLDNFPDQKDDIMNDLLSYQGYNEE